MIDEPRGDGVLSHLVRAVSEAAQLASRIRRRQLVAIDKPDRTRLTMADLAVQALITQALEQACPGEALVAEEDASSIVTDVGRALVPPLIHALQPLLPGVTPSELARLLDRGAGPPAPRSWVLDPIDGTEGFVRTGGHYAVALALLEDGQPQVGLLGCPTLDAGGFPELRSALRGSLIVAQRGRGAWLSPLAIANFTRIGVSERTTLRSARGLVSFVESHLDVTASAAFERAAAFEAPPVRVDGQAKHALIAAGHADFFVRIPADPAYREAIWDHAAGALAIEEAGGRITDLQGRALDFAAGRRLVRNRGIVASNGHIHDALLIALGPQRTAN